MRRIDENKIPNCVQNIKDNCVHVGHYAYFNTSDDFTLKMTVTTKKIVYVDWGDGQKQQWVADGTEKTVAHDYASAGAYKVKITGDIGYVTTLDLSSQANVSGDIIGFKYLTSLTILYLYNTSATGDIADIANLTSLATLHLGGTSATGDIADIATLTSLTYLRLYNTSVTGDIADIATLTSLTNLHLGGTDVDYTTGTLPAWGAANIRIDSTELQSSSEVDQFLIDYAAGLGASSGGVLNIAGDNAARTTASDAAKATILAASITLTVNE